MLSKLLVSEEILQKTLELFQGKPLDKNSITAYQYYGFAVFDNPTYLLDPRIQFTLQLNITDVYLNYVANYKLTDRVTFATFIKWIAIKAMSNTPFLWRQLNGQWYEFTNLPLLVTRRTHVRRELELYILENVNKASWADFCKMHEDYKDGKLPDLLNSVLELPYHNVGYQLLNVHLPRLTSYNITTRTIYAHQPWVVFSDRYEQDNETYLPLYLNYSHATLTPEDAELFLKQFIRLGKMTPADVESTVVSPLINNPLDPNPSNNLPF